MTDLIDEKALEAAIEAFAQHIWETDLTRISINPETMQKALEAYESSKPAPTGDEEDLAEAISDAMNSVEDYDTTRSQYVKAIIAAIRPFLKETL